MKLDIRGKPLVRFRIFSPRHDPRTKAQLEAARYIDQARADAALQALFEARVAANVERRERVELYARQGCALLRRQAC